MRTPAEIASDRAKGTNMLGQQQLTYLHCTKVKLTQAFKLRQDLDITVQLRGAFGQEESGTAMQHLQVDLLPCSTYSFPKVSRIRLCQRCSKNEFR